MNTCIIDDQTPLEPKYVPAEFPYRGDEHDKIRSRMENKFSAGPHTLQIQGPRGTGKTHLCLNLLNNQSTSTITSYIPCHKYNTQYKVLKQIYQAVTDEQPADGHHTTEFQRIIEERTQAIPAIVVLDELEFLLQNDGNDLLYYLSRLTTNLTIILISSHTQELEQQLEPRTKSSLQPEKLEIENYTTEQRYNIIADRARQALTTQSVHRQALQYIAGTTPNISLGLHWLKTAAHRTNNVITKALVENVQPDAYQHYSNHLLTEFTHHHELVFQAVHDLTKKHEKQTIRTGAIYDRYNKICKKHTEEPLSNRRISDYLKHLELLKLIQAEYHYGGQKGKTREIKPTKPW